MSTGRFAPSPTGDLHLGNLRTAVLAWLWSRHERSRFVVRMEDLDRVTSDREHERRQLADLARLGVDWDGEVVRQSDRFDRYRAALERLVAAGLTYPCFCTRREIAEAAAAPHHLGRGYPGTCRDLGAAEQERRAKVRSPALRLRSPDETVVVTDEVLGVVERRPDDLVLRRNDGVPAYNLAVVVDDDAQGVGIVVRADDLADATPGQVLLQRLLGLTTPRYAHVPLVLSPAGTRLAKRDGAVTLADRRTAGDRDLDVARWILRSSGQRVDETVGTPRGLLDAAAAVFDPSLLPRSAVVLDADTLAGAAVAPSGPE